MGETRRLRVIFGTTLLVFSAALWQLIDLHSSPYEITRTRNSLIAQVGKPEDFAWEPPNVPEDFLVEDQELVPAEFAISALRKPGANVSGGGWYESIRIAEHLAQGPGTGEGIMSNTIETYRTIMSEVGGYCSDYTQVFNGIANASNVWVREWGMSFDGYSGNGHAFSEVYDTDLRKWIFIDSYNSFYVIDGSNRLPLSVLEFRDRLLSARLEEIEIKVIVPDRFLFASSELALEYYRHGADQFYLYFGNNVFSYDDYPVTRLLGTWSRALEQGAAMISGIHPRIKIIRSETNGDLIEALFSRRNKVVICTLIIMIFGLLMLVEFGLFLRIRQRRRLQ